jgi:hypothetical protein
LNTQAYARLLERNFSDTRDGTIGAPAGNDDDFLDVYGWTLLLEDGLDGAANIRLFIISHNAYATTSIFLTL